MLNPLVVDNAACLPDGERPSCKSDDMFNASALAAIAKWRYTPKLENGTPVKYEGVQTIIRFELEDPQEGCLYAGKLYSVGETHTSELGDDVLEQTCIKGSENPGDYRWAENKLNGRPMRSE